LGKPSPKSQGFFGWEDCQVEKREGSYGKGECYTYDFVVRIANQSKKKGGKKRSTNKKNGGFRSSIGGVAKGKSHDFECSCNGKAW
jgi:hypothetical protein